MSDSITREEQYLNAIANGESIDLKPITREEQFLAKAAGQNVRVPTPITRKEKFLSKISGTGGGKPEQEKAVEITENGTTEITADEGFTLSKVTANVNVSASGGESAFVKYLEERLVELTADDLRGASQIKKAGVFRGYKTLKSVEIGDNITSIGQYAFAECPNLAIVTMNVPPRANILNYVFSYDSPITRVNIDNLANWCDVGLVASSSSPAVAKVATVYIKNSLGVYEPAINIEIPNTVTIIRSYVFYHWKDMSSVIIPNSVTTIQTEAFNRCESLTSVTIGNGVTSIGSKAFNCGGTDFKTTFTFLGTTPPTISNVTFGAVDNIEKIIVPKGCGEAYKTATNWANYADYIEEAAE